MSQICRDGRGNLSASCARTERATLNDEPRNALYTLCWDLRDSSVETQSKHNLSSPGQSIVILDFGAQYTQLIARRIREQNVFSVLLPCTAQLDEVRNC